MFQSSRTALSELSRLRNSARNSAPAIDGDARSIQLITRELQIFAGELSCATPESLTALLQPTLDAIPNAPGALGAWVIRALLVDAMQRIDAHFGAPPRRDLSNMDVLWRAGSSEVVRAVVRHHIKQIQESHSSPEAPPSCGDSRIDRALDYIRTHCHSSSLALGDVSDFVRLSRWHLSRLFTRHLGVTYRDLVRELRMARATSLLDEDLLSVKEVAAQLGFAHPTEFDRQFKQSFGMTPTQWRAQHASGVSTRQPLQL